MARSQSRWGSLLGFVGRVFGRGSEKSRRRGKSVAARRRLLVESLEIRSVMATDFAAISGLVFKDTSTNGYNAGEEVSGALIRLYVDDGDGVFEPGTQDLAPAVPISATATTNTQGIYRFNQLTAATYWVQQPAQTVGAVSLSEAHRLVTVTSVDADGTVGRTIDTFATNGPSVTATTNASPSSAFQAAPESLGGERELYAEILHTTLAPPNVDQVQFSVNAGQLNLNPSFTSTGLYIATWDGADQNTGSLNASGLGAVDLTNGGQATALRLRVSVAEPNGIATMRVFTDATRFSEMQLVIPERTTIPGGVADLLFPMNSFQVAGQTGGANFASVGAVVLEIEAVNDSMDGVATFIGSVGPTVKTQNFDNQTATDLAIVKTVDDNTPNRNQVVNFTITVTNNGPTAATGVQVTDNLPSGLVISGTPVASVGSFTNGVWTIGTLGTTAGQNSATLTLPVQVTALGTAQGGVITNTATITALDQFDTNTNNNTDSEALTPNQVDLGVTKTVDDSTPDKNQQVTFTITVTNNSQQTATNVQFTDLLPSGLGSPTATPTVGSYTAGNGVWNIGTLAPQASATLTIAAPVVGSGQSTTITNNVALTNLDQFDTNSSNNTALATLTPNVVDLAVTKTVNDSTPDRNQEVTYTITVTNTTSITATGVQLTDPTPSGITNVRLVNASQGSFDANTGVWTVGTINGSGSATLQIAGTVATTGTGGSVVNTAAITAVNQFETNTANNQASATLVPNQVDLSVTKTVDDSTPDRNQEVVYTITVSNATGPAATNVQLTDVLPAGITAPRVDSVSQGTYSTSNGVWTIGTINGGGSATLRLAGAVSSIPSGTTLTNTATISALDQFETRTDNNSASAIVTPNQVDLQVTKTVDDSTLDRNQNGTFTVTVTNLSNITATNVVVTDQFPSALTLTGTPTASQGTYVSGTGVWTVGTLNGGASATLTMAGRTDTFAAGSITNTASLTSVSQFESPTTNNSGSASVTLNQVDIAVTKTVNSTKNVAVNRNEEVLFVITATNNGPNAASNVQITDVLPAGLTLVGTPTASTGTFNSTTGVWTIPSLSATAGQNSATLQIRAQLTAAGNNITLTNQASLTSVDQFDQLATNNTDSATVRNSVLSKRNYLADAF